MDRVRFLPSALAAVGIAAGTAGLWWLLRDPGAVWGWLLVGVGAAALGAWSFTVSPPPPPVPYRPVAPRPTMADVTAEWKAAPARLRLPKRGELLELAELLAAAGEEAERHARAAGDHRARCRQCEEAVEVAMILETPVSLVYDRFPDVLASGPRPDAVDRVLERARAVAVTVGLEPLLAPALSTAGYAERENALVRDLRTACGNLADAAEDATGDDPDDDPVTPG